jgi:hypothetical protein
MTPTEQKKHRLEMLLRQRHCWFIEANGANRALVESLHAETDALKVELGVTDDEQFLRDRSAA